MLSITLGKSDITSEVEGDQVKITFNQEFRFEPVNSLVNGGFCYNPDQLVGGSTSEKFDPEMRGPYSKMTKPLMDKIRQQLRDGKIMEEWVRIPFGVPTFLFNHDPSFVYAPPKFEIGQSVYFFGQEGRVWDGIIKEVSKIEALVQGKGLAWVPIELLFTSLKEAYAARDKEEVEAKEKADILDRVKSFKVGQQVYVVIKNEAGYGILKGGLIDIGEYESEVKIQHYPSNRCVFNTKDIFHTMQEANDQANHLTSNG